MKCLALDTTTDICSIALADESGVLGEYNSAHKMDLSRRLMPNILRMLEDCGVRMGDLDAIGISLGPGSFTGLRIGVTTAKTLAHVLGIPIAGMTSLDLLAHQFDHLPDAVVCPLVKVRKGEAYYAFFRACQGTIEHLTDYASGTLDEIVDTAHSFESQPIIFCGDALKDSLPRLHESLGSLVVPAPAWLSYPKASILAREAIRMVQAGQSTDPLSLVPFYIRRSTPEERLAGSR